MRLKIRGYDYQPSQVFLIQGNKARRKKKPGRYIAGGNGSEIRGYNPQVLVDLEDADTGEIYYAVDIYMQLKMLTYGMGKLTQRRVEKILAFYQSRQPFAADNCTEWEELPGLRNLY